MYSILLFGATSVGKSRIYARLSSSAPRVVSSCLNTTRDYEEFVVWKNPNGEDVALVDAAGIGDGLSEAGCAAIDMSFALLKKADLVLFVLDGKNAELTVLDYDNASKVRKFAKKTLLVINKCESKINLEAHKLLSLGFGEPIYISAEHNIGFLSLKSKIEERFGFELEERNTKNKKLLKFSILGRPNAGKSTLFNKIVGFERSITSQEQGTTRDVVSYEITYKDNKLILLDTAGLRKTYKRVVDEVENSSANIALASIRISNICMIIIDGFEGINQQDFYIIRKVIEAKKGIVIVVNKCDLIDAKAKEEIEWIIRNKVREISFLPILFISSKNENKFDFLMGEALRIFEEMNRKIGTSTLNKWLSSATSKHKPAAVSNHKFPMKAKYIVQVDGDIPSFKLFVNNKNLVDKNYIKYLSNSLREYFKIASSPVDIIILSSGNPYSDVNRK
ncbi:GTP binding Der [Candidatus Cyrtobacter comes]|uniref:GTPase Der n=1 Tax=Candidatus Cyrtobacter comes TaxID=675776 RepID=A0ABU5L721_9RICK|nr:ribosome biogenesis GTPase Der [Candidatus Cyrtobacter comes]MDZ5761921.1 GTP binding Der [Candidatus Cyrtobacter comes]